VYLSTSLDKIVHLSLETICTSLSLKTKYIYLPANRRYTHLAPETRCAYLYL